MGEGGSTAIATGATVRSTESIDYLLAEMLGNTNFSDVGNRIVTPDIASFLNISPYKHMAFDLRLVSEKGGRISKGNNFLVYESKHGEETYLMRTLHESIYLMLKSDRDSSTSHLLVVFPDFIVRIDAKNERQYANGHGLRAVESEVNPARELFPYFYENARFYLDLIKDPKSHENSTTGVLRIENNGFCLPIDYCDSWFHWTYHDKKFNEMQLNEWFKKTELHSRALNSIPAMKDDARTFVRDIIVMNKLLFDKTYDHVYHLEQKERQVWRG